MQTAAEDQFTYLVEKELLLREQSDALAAQVAAPSYPNASQFRMH